MLGRRVAFCKKIFVWGFLVLGWLGLLMATETVINSRVDTSSDRILAALVKKIPPPTIDIAAELRREALRRAQKYEELLRRRHLDSGMVIHRTANDTAVDHCDSLLFSSLRFVALSKLGFTSEAAAAWKAIDKSRHEGEWFRHPRCRQPASRDMLLGVISSLTQTPPGTLNLLEQLVTQIEDNNGFFAQGPFYVSFLTPGMGHLLFQLIKRNDVSVERLPEVIRYGFLTSEFDSLTAVRGYQSHLIALVTWIELEISNTPSNFSEPSFRSVAAGLSPFLSPFAMENMAYQRLEWITFQLTQLDPNNMFFKWLRLKSEGLLTDSTRYHMLSSLLNMPQFPRDRLPQNCDRRADYLWQRDSIEHRGYADCTKTFNGVDFLWMTSLLLEPDLSRQLAQE